MSAWPPYAGYRHTHLGWLSEIPEHWTLTRLKYLGSAITGLTYGPEDVVEEGKGTLVLRSSNVQNRTLTFDDNVFVSKEIPDKLVTRKGDILICSRNGSRALIGKNAMIDDDAVGVTFGAFMTVFRSKYNDFLLQVFNSPVFDYQSGTFLTSTINQLTVGNLYSFEVPLPPLGEQTQIAKFLDYETAKIDALIEKQQQLIALFKEKRQAVISHAVTKGLNPDAPMRDSGVEWLGKVPKHWEVCRVKQAIAFITSGPRGWSELITEQGTDVFLQSGDLNDKLGLRLDTAKRISPPQNAEEARTKMRNGDVVVCITGANTGRVAVALNLAETVYVNQHLSLIRPLPRRIAPKYLATVLASSGVKAYFAVKQYGLKEGLSLTNVAEAPLCLPPLPEQEAILVYLEELEVKLDRLESAANSQIMVLQERRAALISAAVTGKIDVRGWKPPAAD